MKLRIICFAAALAALLAFARPEALASSAFIFDIEPETAEVPIIMYHMVTKNAGLQGKYGISPEAFEEDLRFLKENGYTTVVIRDLIKFVERGKNLPDKPVVLTFDDGLGSDYRYVYPLLEKYDMSAVMSIVGKLADEYSNGEDGKAPHISWRLAGEMHKSKRVELQNHSYDLHGGNGSARKQGETDEGYRKRLTEDIQKAQDLFRENIGYEPTTFTYPYGAIGKGEDEILKDLGFKATLSCAEGINRLVEGEPDCLFRLKRNIRTSNRSAEDVLKKLQK